MCMHMHVQKLNLILHGYLQKVLVHLFKQTKFSLYISRKYGYHSKFTLMPMFMGARPPKGTLLVAISHRMTAKLYMSAALLSMSSGRCCRAMDTNQTTVCGITGKT